jgi:hypothetical protein
MTFLKIRSHPCSWWSRHKTPQSLSIAQDSFALVQVSRSSQLNASSVSHCSGLRIQPSCTLPPERDDRMVVICGGSSGVPLLPQHDLKPPWIATDQISCSCNALPPLPVVIPCGHCLAMFISNPSLRYVSLTVDWSLDVTPLLQVMLGSLRGVPQGSAWRWSSPSRPSHLGSILWSCFCFKLRVVGIIGRCY